MHDPMTVAHEIRRPWPSRSSFKATSDDVRWRVRLHHDHWIEVGGDNCGCPGDPLDTNRKHNPFPWWKPRSYTAFWRLAGRDFYWPPLLVIWHVEPGGHDGLTVCSRRYQDKHGKWHYTKGWRWHVHHWKLQVPPLQHARRSLLTRCAWCGGKSRNGDPVNCGRGWHAERSRWWQGEPGLYHSDCLSLDQAHATCTCDAPVLRNPGPTAYGTCGACGRFRPYGLEAERLARLRELQAVPKGARR